MKRAVVVDDSAIWGTQLREWLEADGDVEVIGVAADGESAIDLITRLRPDVATIDLRLPGMSGLEVVTQLMKRAPLPLLVLTGDPTGDDPELAFEAIRRGALDLLLKPSMDDEEAIRALRAHVRWLAGVPVVRHLDRGESGHRPGSEPAIRVPEFLRPSADASRPHEVRPNDVRPNDRPALPPTRARTGRADDLALVGIAASAGGPSALATVLGSLPAELPACLAIVQHLPRGFAPSFVSFLQTRCALTVRLAEAGLVPRAGMVVLAPDDHHLELVDGRFALTSGPPVEGHRPSGTVLLRSLAHCGSSAIGVVLSGIGRDGADGLRAMRDRHAITFAQDETSSVVYGMPRAAVEEGAAQQVLPVAELGDAITAAATCVRRWRKP
ncbi:MAG TPA: chemotaxis protein CheB [Kofleriaceae bacterium]|nr:chemotaxis protein CheB [Kofleriaceae bacterium]